MTKARYQTIKLLGLLLLLGFTLATFFPALQNTFTIGDDESEILKNPLVLECSWNSVVKAFTSFRSNQYMPLPQVAYSVLHAVFGFDSFYFQLTNLILHLTCVLAVFCFFRRLTRDLRTSLVASALFAIHPIQVQSVAWAPELRNLLYSVFLFGAMSSYVNFARGKGPGSYLATFVFMTMSLLSKSLAFPLPILFLLCDYRLGRPITLERIKEKLPFILLSGFFLLIAIHAISSAQVQDPLGERIQLASYSIFYYFPKLLLPTSLCSIYPYPDRINGAYPLFVQVSPILLGILTLGVFASILFTRKLFFAFFVYLVNIAPVSRIVQVGARMIAQDHFIYVPGTGIFLGGAEAFFWAIRRSAPLFRKVLWAGLLLILLILSLMTQDRIRVWENTVTLYEDVLAKFPNIQVPYNQLGLYYLVQGDSETALRYFTLMEKRFPGEARPLWMQAKVHFFTGNIPAALALLQRAEAIGGPTPEILIPRGTAHLLLHDYRQAIEVFNAALQNSPREAAAYLNRSWAHFFSGDVRQAVIDVSQALDIAPDPAGHIARAIFMLFTGQPASATSDLMIARTSAGSLFPEYMRKAGQNFLAFGGAEAAGRRLLLFPFGHWPGISTWTQ